MLPWRQDLRRGNDGVLEPITAWLVITWSHSLGEREKESNREERGKRDRDSKREERGKRDRKSNREGRGEEG